MQCARGARRVAGGRSGWNVRRGRVPGAGAAAAEPASTPAELFARDRRPIILYDGVCGLCNGGVNLALDLDEAGEFRFAALQSGAGRSLLEWCGRDAGDISSIVLVGPDRAFSVKSEAVLKIAERLRLPLPFLSALGLAFPAPIRDAVYDVVADNRYELLGIRDECRLGDDRPSFRDRFVE